MQTNLSISLAAYKPISTYTPRAGDFVVWHGWFTHYYGIVNGCDEDKIRIVCAGMPLLLFTMEQEEMDKHHRIIYLNKIRKSRGEYAIQQNNVWYV